MKLESLIELVTEDQLANQEFMWGVHGTIPAYLKTDKERLLALKVKLSEIIYGDCLEEVKDWSLERLVDDLLWRWQDALKRSGWR